MKIVTSGLKFLDIDAYAGCVAYAELLNLRGIDAIAYSSATMNGSIPRSVRSWNTPLLTKYSPTEDDTYIIVDVSEPDYLDKIVDNNKVEQVIDHHLGNEKYWEEKIGQNATIEFVGAACTQIYEFWQKAEMTSRMSETSARLLISGILDNTLNFKAKVTTERDHIAYNELLKRADLPENWPSQYFEECEEAIFVDIEHALINDAKFMNFPNLSLDKVYVGQLVIWNAERAVSQYKDVIEGAMSSYSENWFVNIVNIKDGQSTFLAPNSTITSWLQRTLDLEFNSNLARADRLWLRKEIMKQSISLQE